MISRTLSRCVKLETADAETFYALRYLECDPEIATSLPEEETISVEPYRSYYRISRDGEVLREQITTKAVTETLHAHMFVHSLADYPTAPVVHAASLLRGGRRILLVGPKGAGKTTLVLRLIQEGYDVEGDENVFVTPEGLIARPRGLRVKQSTAALVPRIAHMLLEAPYYEDALGQRIYNLDPRSVGAPSWRIGQGRADATILLRPNHGGYSSLRPVSSLTLMRDLLLESGLSRTDRGQAVSALTKVIGSGKGFDLSLGDLGGAVRCLDKAIEQLN